MCLLLAGCYDGEYTYRGFEPNPVASIALSSPSADIVIGATMKLTAITRDSRGVDVGDVAGVVYRSSNPASVRVSPDGVVSAVFAATNDPSAFVSAAITRGGVTLKDSVRITVRPPAVFDFAALMLSENEPVGSIASAGIGVTYISIAPGTIRFTVAWSGLTGPATGVHLHGVISDPEGGEATKTFALSPQVGTDGSFIREFSLSAGLQDTLVRLMRDGELYMDVHTAAHPGGEIRGTIEVILNQAAMSVSPRKQRKPAPSSGAGFLRTIDYLSGVIALKSALMSKATGSSS